MPVPATTWPRPLQRQQGTACSMASPPGQVAQPRPQHVDITTVPPPWQSGQGVVGESADSVMAGVPLALLRTSPCWR